MRIALMGTRGIPANYGGFETFYENLGPRLAAHGHTVSVYVRPHAIGGYDGTAYRGTRLVRLPSIRSKHLETISHSFLSVLHGLTRRYDIVFICGVGNTPLAWIPRLGRARVVLNVDSADWKRRKWGRGAALYLRSMERFAAASANVIVADSQVIVRRYREQYGAEALFFPYGANVIDAAGTDALDRYGLEPRGYYIWVGRLEPEARVEELLEAFRLTSTDRRLVIVGDTTYEFAYRESLQRAAGKNVVFTGYQFGDSYRQLSFHAFGYVQTSPTSGTSPALLDQMAAGNAVIVRGTPTNLETIEEAGLSYAESDPVLGLVACLSELERNPERVSTLRRAAVARVRSTYSWDRITERYEELFERLVSRERIGALP